jgi:uncharacterized protein (TIGR03086 family)
MVTENLERAFASTRNVLANVKPDQLDDPTPCKSWAVRDLINHIVAGAHWFGLTVETGDGALPPDRDWTEGDMVAAFDEGAQRSVAAFAAPGAQEKIVKVPFGEFPGSVFMGLATTDTFVHGWDLAKATGQPTDLDPELAEQVMEGARLLVPDQVRGDEPLPFAHPVEPPPGCGTADRLAAFMGRQL